MRVFEYRDQLIADYAAYVRSFIAIRDRRIGEHVDRLLEEGLLWPQPLIQLNPAFEPGRWIDDLVETGVLHPGCGKVLRRAIDTGKPFVSRLDPPPGDPRAAHGAA